MAEVVIDASALVDLLIGGPVGDAVARRLSSHVLDGPAHIDAEAFSALGRLHRAGEVEGPAVETMLGQLASAPIIRHSVAELLIGAWRMRSNLRLADAIYVGLAESLGVRLVTTDARLRPIGLADVVTA
jgi:predicted nucleic acid-binding protein